MLAHLSRQGNSGLYLETASITYMILRVPSRQVALLVRIKKYSTLRAFIVSHSVLNRLVVTVVNRTGVDVVYLASALLLLLVSPLHVFMTLYFHSE